jgi:putative colanic acid biosynthesis acetyltransferase WcaF
VKKDIARNRRSRKWSRTDLAMRLLWDCAQVLFRASPRLLWGWRTWLLRLFGARIGRNVHIYPSVRIIIPWNLEIGDETAVGDSAILYALGKITLGQRVTISQGSHLCAGTHDYRVAARPLLKLPITVGDDCWIAADAFIGPNVTVGREAIIGARAVVVKDVPDCAILAGNPARVIGTTSTT